MNVIFILALIFEWNMNAFNFFYFLTDSSEMDDESEGSEANPRVSEDSDDKDKMDVEVNESNSVPSTSEDNAPATPEKTDNAAATAATSTSSPSSDPSTTPVAAVSPVVVGDSASSSSDVTQESVEDSSHQVKLDFKVTVYVVKNRIIQTYMKTVYGLNLTVLSNRIHAVTTSRSLFIVSKKHDLLRLKKD